jgi:hypothetical protein
VLRVRARLQSADGVFADQLSIGQPSRKSKLATDTDRLHSSPLGFLITNAALEEPRVGRFMDDYRSNHFRRLGEDDSGVEFTAGDGSTEGSGVAEQGHDPDAFEIAYQTVVTKAIVRLYQTERLRHTPKFRIFLLAEPRPDPQPVNPFAIGLM